METGLLKQTKAKLVRIILRKDAVEKKLRRQVEYMRMIIDEFGIEEPYSIAKNAEVEDEKED